MTGGGVGIAGKDAGESASAGRGTLPLPPVLAISAAAGLLLLYVTRRYGPGITPDSVEYFAAAENLVSGRGLLSYDMAPLVKWPPLYPALLALLHFVGVSVVNGARYLNAAVYAAIMFVSGVLLSSTIKLSGLALAGLLAVAALYPLFLVSAFAISEPIFILLVLLFLLAASEYIRNGNISSLLTAAALAALACLCRYIGVTVILTGLLLLLTRRGTGTAKKVRDLAVFIAVSCAPVAAWLYRNYVVSHSLTGERGPAMYGLKENLSYAFDVLSGWLVPGPLPAFLRAGVFVLLMAVLVLYRERGRTGNSPVTSAVLFIFVYVAFLVASSSTVAFDGIDNRLLSPAAVPLMLLVFYLLDNLKAPFAGSVSNRALSAIAVIAFALWLTFPLIRLGRSAANFASYGPGGYSTESWKKSELIGYLRNHRPEEMSFSNAPAAVYFLTGVPAGEGPVRHLYNSSPDVPEYLERFRKKVEKAGKVRLVWFNDAYGEHFYRPDELAGKFNVRLDKELPDGAVYTITPLEGYAD